VIYGHRPEYDASGVKTTFGGIVKTLTKPPLTLEAVADHFERWRSNKKKGERIPEALWFEAVGLVTDYPLSRVCRTLHLCATDLKRHQAALSASKELAVARMVQKQNPCFQAASR
jgi:hypothetical protein